MINIWKCRFQRRWPTCNCKNINFRCKGFRLLAKRAAIHKQCIAMVSVALRIINIIHTGFSECALFLHSYYFRSRNLQRKKKLRGCISSWAKLFLWWLLRSDLHLFDLQKFSMFAKAFLAASILPLPPLAFSLSDTLLDKFGPKKQREIRC